MTGPLHHSFDKLIETDVAEFKEILGRKLSSITVDDIEGITDIGFEGGIHLILKVQIIAGTYKDGDILLTKITGDLVHVH